MLGYSRQHYYKQKIDRRRQEGQQQKILQFVQKERKLLPKVGTRKLCILLAKPLKNQGIKIGRDGLFELLRQEQMLIRPRRQYVQTTNSRHWMHKYPNLIETVDVHQAEQVWVSDITYIRLRQNEEEAKWCYLSLITDAFSRRIMGYCLARSLSSEHSLKALQMALRNRRYPDRSLIHHSDRGLQYCSQDYVQTAARHQIQMSMTEHGDPYENALAERMNRTIKEEFCLDEEVPSFAVAAQCVKEAVELYNAYRPHLALGGATPESIHNN